MGTPCFVLLGAHRPDWVWDSGLWYPEAQLIRDVAAITGSAARSRGRALRVFAALIAAGAVLTSVVLLWLLALVWSTP